MVPTPRAGRVLILDRVRIMGGKVETPLDHKFWEHSFISGPCDTEPCDVDLGYNRLGGRIRAKPKGRCTGKPSRWDLGKAE